MSAPLKRYGGKGRIAHLLVPHFAHAMVYAEPCFGAGSVFYALPAGLYRRAAVNDLDASLVTFFRVLRDRPEELLRVCSLTPHARDEWKACRDVSNDPLEEARRVWVRARQSFSASAVGGWKADPGDAHAWAPAQAGTALVSLLAHAARLRDVEVDNVDAARFVERWGREPTMVYVDPPYVHEARCTQRAAIDYRHEMTADDHRGLAAACHAAAERGARVCVSGYPSALYDELYAGWRRVDIDVAAHAAHRDTRTHGGARRTESLWLSYPAADEIGASRPAAQGSLLGVAGAP